VVRVSREHPVIQDENFGTILMRPRRRTPVVDTGALEQAAPDTTPAQDSRLDAVPDEDAGRPVSLAPVDGKSDTTPTLWQRCFAAGVAIVPWLGQSRRKHQARVRANRRRDQGLPGAVS
jgi:hypothetical protein